MDIRQFFSKGRIQKTTNATLQASIDEKQAPSSLAKKRRIKKNNDAESAANAAESRRTSPSDSKTLSSPVQPSLSASKSRSKIAVDCDEDDGSDDHQVGRGDWNGNAAAAAVDDDDDFSDFKVMTTKRTRPSKRKIADSPVAKSPLNTAVSSHSADESGRKHKKTKTSPRSTRTALPSLMDSKEDVYLESQVRQGNENVTDEIEEDFGVSIRNLKKGQSLPSASSPPRSNPRTHNAATSSKASVAKSSKIPDKKTNAGALSKTVKKEIAHLIPNDRTEFTFDVDSAAKECLAGTTFVFTGILTEDLSREQATEMVKILGGRVTTAVSTKTNYLVTGPILEDGRPYTEGSKYKKAIASKNVHLVKGTSSFYGLLARYSERARHDQAESLSSNNIAVTNETALVAASVLSSSTAVNPYAKPTNACINPYARSSNASSITSADDRKMNPYGKRNDSSQDSKKKPESMKLIPKQNTNELVPSMLWVDKYKPTTSADVIGNQDCVRKLATWLSTWETKFNRSEAFGMTFTNPAGPWKAALLSGPPGIGSKYHFLHFPRQQNRGCL
jgi:replication factor C subunit 1